MKHIYILKGLIIGFYFTIYSVAGDICMIGKLPIMACLDKDCDTVLECAMEKQRNSLEDRLDDLKKAIEENTKQTEHQTKIIEQEVLAYNRLLARVKQESLSLKEASYLSKKMKDSESLGTIINTMGKGK